MGQICPFALKVWRHADSPAGGRLARSHHGFATSGPPSKPYIARTALPVPSTTTLRPNATISGEPNVLIQHGRPSASSFAINAATGPCALTDFDPQSIRPLNSPAMKGFPLRSIVTAPGVAYP